jgi:hypothetical protein
METQRVLGGEPSRARAGAAGARHVGGRYESIRVKAKRRRLVANAIVLSTTVAVLAMAAAFYLLLSR